MGTARVNQEEEEDIGRGRRHWKRKKTSEEEEDIRRGRRHQKRKKTSEEEEDIRIIARDEYEI